jgi:hypothetical protein
VSMTNSTDRVEIITSVQRDECPGDQHGFAASYPIGDVAEQRTADDPSDRHHKGIQGGIGHGHMLAVMEKGRGPSQSADRGGDKEQAANDAGEPALGGCRERAAP